MRASYARHVTAETRHLSLTEAGYVDAGVAESADGRISWTRFEALVEAYLLDHTGTRRIWHTPTRLDIDLVYAA